MPSLTELGGKPERFPAAGDDNNQKKETAEILVPRTKDNVWERRGSIIVCTRLHTSCLTPEEHFSCFQWEIFLLQRRRNECRGWKWVRPDEYCKRQRGWICFLFLFYMNDFMLVLWLRAGVTAGFKCGSWMGERQSRVSSRLWGNRVISTLIS